MPPPDCPFCEHQNPAGAKFCNECGSPLHLTPCGDCGAVNNVTDTHCWRCGGLLLQSDPPAQREDFARDPGAPERQLTGFEQGFAASEQDPGELEQEIVALEQELEGLEAAPGPAAARPPVVGQAPRGSSVPGPRAADRRPRRVEQAFGGANIPEPKSLFVQADDAPRGRRLGLMVTAFVVALGSAIAVGTYLYDRDRASSARGASPPSEPLRAAAPPDPSVARDVGETSAALPAPAAEPGPKAIDAPLERRVASDAGEAAPAPAPAAAPDPGCPPAVEAMTLCEWLVRANRQ